MEHRPDESTTDPEVDQALIEALDDDLPGEAADLNAAATERQRGERRRAARFPAQMGNLSGGGGIRTLGGP